MRLLITGGSGNLGFPLSHLASQNNSTTSTYFKNPHVGGGNPTQIDLRDRNQTSLLVETLKPDTIIHTATSDRSDDMFASNREAAHNITEAAKAINCRLITLSTDMIFDGTKSPYSEDAHPTPLSQYGQVKAENEVWISACYAKSLIVRTSLIYDLSENNRQIHWMLEKIKQGEKITLFTDEIRQPICSWNLASALLELTGSSISGILNIAGADAVSRWEYGSALLRSLGYDPKEVAYPITIKESELSNRPPNCTLDITKAQSILKTPLLPLAEGISLAASHALN